MPSVRAGIWCSVRWRSCSPTGRLANFLGLVFPGGPRRYSHRPGAHTVTARRGARRTRVVSQIVRIFYAKFLTLSKIAYTKFSSGPAEPSIAENHTVICSSYANARSYTSDRRLNFLASLLPTIFKQGLVFFDFSNIKSGRLSKYPLFIFEKELS